MEYILSMFNVENLDSKNVTDDLAEVSEACDHCDFCDCDASGDW